MTLIKRLANRVLGPFGLELYSKRFRRGYLSRLCEARTVIDVGVGYGTYPLYRAFPDAQFLLIEPLIDYKPSIDRIARQYRCDVYFKGVGDREGTLEINVDPNDLQRSTFADRTELSAGGNAVEKRTIDVVTLDAILRERGGVDQPVLLKIDTEGHELHALRGATELLKITDIVIAEASIAKRFKDSYEFEDLVGIMRDRGFYLFSFLTVRHLDGEPRPRFADVVFKRR